MNDAIQTTPSNHSDDTGDLIANASDKPSVSPGAQSTITYAAAYETLHEIAEKLRQAGPDDIESLIEDYRRAMAAYRVCSERLALIRQELDLEP